MALKKNRLGILFLFLLVLVTSFGVSLRVASLKSITPNAPSSQPEAIRPSKCPEAEACPGRNNTLYNCHPAEGDGTPKASLCNRKGRVESCGGEDFCCPKSGETWTNDLSACCSVNTWTPDPSTVCSGNNFEQTSNCGTKRQATGTKTTGNCVACTNTTWTPNTNTVCTGETFEQTSNCGTTRNVTGTKTDSVWTPATSTTCTGETFTQTGDCGGTREVAGTKFCCTDSTWTPVTTNTCSEKKLIQTSNCGNEREVSGTKTCPATLTVSTNTFADDARNKSGVYFIDKKITKVSRDQFYVYTMEVKNTGEGSANNFVISDSLIGQNQSLIAYVDGEERCDYDSPSKKFSCEIESLAPKAKMELKFRVKVAKTAINGKIIKNTVKVNYDGKIREGSTSTLISSIVNCNESCSNDSECVAGLACDVFSNTCRKPACLKSNTCSCVTPTATVKPTTTTTVTITTKLTSTITPTEDTAPTDLADEVTPTEMANLPETGILDFSGIATFGGGLLLAIVGILLAL